LEKAGVAVGEEPVAVAVLKLPEEFQTKCAEVPALKAAFEALTPGRQRAYGFYFSGAKQSKTRLARIEKWLPVILKGRGMHD
jgi:uncharacterized protein YdeI (YjbR/CyaY-like superfamily)